MPKKVNKRKNNGENADNSSKKRKIEKSAIEKFPDEILLKIFRYLSTYDILRNVAPVCHRFYDISQDSTLLQEIDLKFQKFDQIMAKNACYAIRRSTSLKKLILDDGNRDSESWSFNSPGFYLSVAIKNCPKLRHIKIDCTRISKTFRYGGIYGGGHQVYNLTDLLDLGSDKEEIFDTALKAAEYVNKFSTSDFQNEQTLGHSSLEQCLTDMDDLNDIIQKKYQNLRFEILKRAKKGLKLCAKLELQSVFGNEKYGDQLHINFIASNCQNLESLDISSNYYTGMININPVLKKQNNTLKCLKMGNKPFTDSELEILKGCKKLQELQICKMSPSFPQLLQLKSLSINFVQFEVDVMSSNLKVENYDNTNNELLKTIALKFPNLNSFRMLYKKTDINYQGIEMLLKDLPHLEYINLTEARILGRFEHHVNNLPKEHDWNLDFINFEGIKNNIEIQHSVYTEKGNIFPRKKIKWHAKEKTSEKILPLVEL